MNCPGCGAAMQAVGNHNHFHCTHCGQFLFPRETGDGVAPLGEPSTKSCPVCHLALEKAMIEGEEVRYCGKCRGFLCALDAFGRIVGKRRALHGPHEQVTEPFDPDELRRALGCPVCNARMVAHPYFGGGNAVVDTCEHCQSIWLDAGELAVIERYVPPGRAVDPVLPLSDESRLEAPAQPLLSLDDLF
jgi:Zn-finger nucleic acid-binding protein